MIDTNNQISGIRPLTPLSRTPQADESGLPADRATLGGPPATFEPWLGGGPGVPDRAPSGNRIGEIPQPPANIEPWLRGEMT